MPFTVVLKTFFQTYTENWLHSAIAQQILLSLFTFELGHKIVSAEKIILGYLLGENLQIPLNMAGS